MEDRKDRVDTADTEKTGQEKDRFEKQADFFLRADGEKGIVRQTYIGDGTRKETDAEHAFSLALGVILFSEYANEKIDVLKTVTMVLIHDIVEIEAGDTYAYDTAGEEAVRGIMGGIFQENQLENHAAFEAIGKDLSQWSVNTPGVHIVTQQFIDLFSAITGSGITFGIVIYTLFFAKSAQLKALAKVEVVPALFNINEPFLFGVPICLNPFMAAPFILTPMIALFLEYMAISVGFIAPYTGVAVPWTTPPIISGFIVGASGGTAIQTALLQAIILAISVVSYFPFMKIIDNQNLANEAAAANADDDDDW